MKSQNKDNIEILKNIKTLSDCIETNITNVREHINTHRHQSTLLKKIEKWHRICSALDIIGDTLLAVHGYIENEYPKTSGLRYIYTYGILQALLQQQDSVFELSKAFDLDFKLDDYQDLKDIRFIRNGAIGHPVGHQKKYFNHISRMSLSKENFTLMKWAKNEEMPTFDNINIYSLIENQFKEIKTLSENIATKLESVDKEHLEKFKGQLLQDIFDSGMSYYFTKVAEGIYAKKSNSYDYKEQALSMLKLIEDKYKSFQEKIEERNELTDYICSDLEQYNHAISKIRSYLNCQDSNLLEADARIYLFYIVERHENFVKIAQEIDEDYQNNNSNNTPELISSSATENKI